MRTRIVGYCLLDAEWNPLVFSYFDDGPAVLPENEEVKSVTATVRKAKTRPLGPGMINVGTGNPGPFTGTQIAAVREDGTPAAAVDLEDPVVVHANEYLSDLIVDLRMVCRKKSFERHP